VIPSSCRMALPARMDAVATSDGSSGGHRAISTPRTMKTIPGTPIISPVTGRSTLPRLYGGPFFLGRLARPSAGRCFYGRSGSAQVTGSAAERAVLPPLAQQALDAVRRGHKALLLIWLNGDESEPCRDVSSLSRAILTRGKS
jgi:hypothetical protein